MTALKLTAFTGEQPRIIPRLLPDFAAQDAIDVRLDDGGLTPVRQNEKVAEIASADHGTIYLHGDDWLSWPGHVHAAPGPVATDRLYVTGDGVPKLLVGGLTYPLAVQPPAGALTATLGGTGAGTTVTRTYVYTWVTALGEESEPSPAAVSVDWKPGNTVTLSGFVAAPAGRAITQQRIYRTQTGATAGTYLYLIAERTASNANYLDTIPVTAFNEPLPSADWNPPPDGLSGLTAMANGIMAGFVGKDLYFSEPYHPHAWPEKYSLTMDYEIVAIAASQTSLMVVTTGTPYIVAGAHPDSMQQVKLEANLPCINARACVNLGFSFCYPSHEGLVAIRADGQIGIVSASLFNVEEWADINAATMVAGQLSGRYVAFYDAVDENGVAKAGALFIDVGSQPFLFRSSAVASAAFFQIENSALYFLKKGSDEIYRLDAPGMPRAPMYWRSKEFVLSTPDTFGAILIDTDTRVSISELNADAEAYQAAVLANTATLLGGKYEAAFASGPLNSAPFGGSSLAPLPDAAGLAVGVIADGVRIATITTPGRPVRLPAGFLARSWEIDVSGYSKVAQISLARTIDELKVIQ